MNIKELTRRVGNDLPQRVEVFLGKANDRQLYRINVKTLAQDIGLEWRDLREFFLGGVTKGAFSLSWEFHCPHCSGITDFKHKFSDIQAEGSCPGCNVSFRNELDKNVEVTFGMVADIHEIKKPVVEKIHDEMLELLKAGKFKMPPQWLSGLDTMTSPTFHEQFGADVLSSEESLSIQRLAFLFTDIKGSTQMYSDLGDATSYQIVRDHFKILFKVVEDQGGVIVKTIGDAIMAVFPKTEQALEAAIAAYDAFRERSWEQVGQIQIKMGIHAGPAIAVTMNERLDYFGNTVNLAARIQGIAEDHSVCISAAAVEDPGARSRLVGWHKDHPQSIRHFKTKLKGIDNPIEVYSLR